MLGHLLGVFLQATQALVLGLGYIQSYIIVEYMSVFTITPLSHKYQANTGCLPQPFAHLESNLQAIWIKCLGFAAISQTERYTHIVA